MKWIGSNIKVAGEGKLRHKKYGWMYAIKRGDRGKNLVFSDDMPPVQHREFFFLSQRNEGFQLTNWPEASLSL
jgi:hypothetical protein